MEMPTRAKVLGIISLQSRIRSHSKRFGPNRTPEAAALWGDEMPPALLRRWKWLLVKGYVKAILADPLGFLLYYFGAYGQSVREELDNDDKQADRRREWEIRTHPKT